MAKIILFNKPCDVLSQFTSSDDKQTLADFVTLPNFYPAGRLDYDSEGLLILTDNGDMQSRIAHPKNKMPKTYWAQLEAVIDDTAIEQLRRGVSLKDGKTRPAKVHRIEPPELWSRSRPIRERKQQATSWIALTIAEGKNRQVRRMTAAVGFPTLRLIRVAIGPWQLDDLQPGESRQIQVNLPTSPSKRGQQRSRRHR